MIMIIVIIFFFLSLLPSFLGFISSPPFQRDRAGQREKKARLPLKLASEHEAWILSFFPAKYALHFSPACPISRGGEGWLSQDRCETQTRRQPRGYRPKVAHPAEWQWHLWPSSSLSSQAAGGRTCVVWVCESEGTPQCASVCVCVTRWKVPGVHLSFPSRSSVNSPLLAASKQKGENKTQAVLDLSSCRIKHVP